MRQLTICALLALVASAMLMAGSSWAQPTMPKLAPGVLKVIPAEPVEADTASGPREFVEVTRVAPQWQPHYAAETETLAGMAQRTTFRRPVWQLEFAFKPVRLLTVPILQGDGTAKARHIWYLLYRLRNTGGQLTPVAEKDEFGHDRFVLQPTERELRFFPVFVLKSHEFGKAYADRVMPEVLDKIHSIEIRDPRVTLYDSISITQVPIEPSTETLNREVWGVATWDNVDRRTDFFSVCVQGLTNAYRWEDADVADEGVAAGRRFFFKTLKLNFYRPGDSVHQHENEFRFGLPLTKDGKQNADLLKLYQLDEPADYTWVYQP